MAARRRVPEASGEEEKQPASVEKTPRRRGITVRPNRASENEEESNKSRVSTSRSVRKRVSEETNDEPVDKPKNKNENEIENTQTKTSEKTPTTTSHEKQEASALGKVRSSIVWFVLLCYLFLNHLPVHVILVLLLLTTIQPIRYTRQLFRSPIVFILILLTYFIGFGMVLHAVFRTVFDEYTDVALVRVGYVSDSFANYWVRIPPILMSREFNLSVPTTYPSHIRIVPYYRTQKETKWTRGSSVSIDNSTDYTGVVRVGDRLVPQTDYEVSFFWDRGSGVVEKLKFPVTGRYSATNETYVDMFHFKTAPKEKEPVSFSFGFGSCIKPNYPYGKGVPGFAAIARLPIDFFLFLGDFIYVDINVNFGTTTKNYRRLYRETLGHGDSVSLFSSVPSLAIFDDHEIRNDWDRGTVEPYPTAVSVFKHYLSSANPRPPRRDASYFTFTHGSAHFFVLDTRTFRTPSGSSLPYTHPNRTMLGRDQLTELIQWLEHSADSTIPKPLLFLVSSVPFTLNWRSSDTWYGYQYERNLIVDVLDDVMEKYGVRVMILSGDRHQVGVSEFVTRSGRVVGVEVSSSPINQFWLPVSMYREMRNCDEEGGGACVFEHSRWQKDRRVYHAPWEGGRTRVAVVGVDGKASRVNVSIVNEEGAVLKHWTY